MKFDKPAGQNPIDQLKVVGKPTDRVEGPLKTTGTAKYAYEYNEEVTNPAYGYILGAAIARGTITRIDQAAAKAAPGVLAIVTAANAGRLETGKFYVSRFLAGPQVDHYHQAVAIVVAETFEQARSAAALLKVEYKKTKGNYDLETSRAGAQAPWPGPYTPPGESLTGDFEGAFKTAQVQLDQSYSTPDQAHAMMEPHATIAKWDGDKLTCWCTIQQLNWGVRDLAFILGIPKENVRLISAYIGGGFGGKGTVLSDLVAASLAARASGRPVKLALQRPLMFNNTIHRPKTIQRIRIGADRDGKITAIGHESWSGNLPGGMTEAATASTRVLYAGANRLTRLRVATLHLAEGSAMRAPGEASGMMALEIAMDEMAEKLNMDPVDFRIKNDTQEDPEKPGRKFSTRKLVECLREGADKFGWERRNVKPGAIKEGDWLIGMGVASAMRGAPVTKSAARVRLDSSGRITVETDMTDIGTGSYTIIAQTAAEMMGVGIDQVKVKLGDSSFPESSGSGGQWGAASSTSGVYAACMKLREAVAAKLGFDAEKAQFSDGRIILGDKSAALGDAAKTEDLVVVDEMTYGELSKEYAQDTFGAHFVEVAVNAFTYEIRVRRMVAVCHAGRILNPKAARSQVIGAMTMGVGAALMEEMVVDKRVGFFVNHDLAGYEVPVHADIPYQEVILLEDIDPTMSPMKAKGIGELGIVGVAAAVANAVYNATGIRVRDYPVTLDKLLRAV
ncbi:MULTISPECIES: aldehyde oxidoreductase molybdenum-binding subunit PaoC [Dyadobacter]|uniref:Xanthine dehydrogenase family protein molybdopterin-binding subunit n=1 Tax=Dyadobacter chenhuakuii TaxID=2909339 RepID=A0ABY4XNG1_9BACT|nr:MULTISPECIES: aldehyde oxidoreductase molybdenum-binding subunit PaoC [Dyadobacter]MCF2494793.1 xanthine dehydrogenase family protein molybdopterin-binding subunit [Dyadobacter chenhuakuii]MCF2519129.1 xanthine dehydrogenase family protein molybdopterin-binding subunit [Dyadobacter sp. CY351]USJ31887.1 xanthine dehydrogenase family protein molybdopterin-binding subunit [Dyadobacter chenhuakuii]